MRKKGRVLLGKVLINKMEKSVVVIIENVVKHSLYGKFVKRTTKFYVHDENNICNINDIVEIRECRPISKMKSWLLVRIVNKAIL
ncbi:30S ribosomal protein S17 [Candidatus Westeberhardia cardiocondylae]|uniref:Small ribosomal subunit protein uS17 n=1 Tax=Candidatus Westeberhardia cardiocondylae TaxID=1594731 RepID=A0A0H5BWL7_9ENTR|nr:30S ribosomal protein S17 [Candidatus Westeberhardia cardiocondylae]CEN32048.1 30S ribosomal protein S17 [Candidatus Westeberhardia cardiocondylae]